MLCGSTYELSRTYNRLTKTMVEASVEEKRRKKKKQKQVWKNV